ncbi:hypothetical protein RJ641_006172 [Dillenia turbinata]|uniref:Uncharacterized protein n=1 Tax=Dillenia turbinata TaxID=194707 RepID=A0AAN8VCG0_9MAGN
MGIANKYLLMVFALSLFNTGCCQCDLNNITIGTQRTGQLIKNMNEWSVRVINSCASSCSYSNLMLSCKGFHTVEAIDPTVFKKQGDKCLVNNGRALVPKSSVQFSYAWDPPFIMFANSSNISC